MCQRWCPLRLECQTLYLGILAGLVQRLTSDNAALRHHLAAVCRDTGRPLPPQFAPLPFPFPPAAAGTPKVCLIAPLCCVLSAHCGPTLPISAAPCGGHDVPCREMILSQTSLCLQIPIQKLKQAARPTPAPAAKKAPAAADAETAEAGTAAASAAADTASGAKGRAPRKKFKARHVAGMWLVPQPTNWLLLLRVACSRHGCRHTSSFKAEHAVPINLQPFSRHRHKVA